MHIQRHFPRPKHVHARRLPLLALLRDGSRLLRLPVAADEEVAGEDLLVGKATPPASLQRLCELLAVDGRGCVLRRGVIGLGWSGGGDGVG